ncbi:EAL domain-containing protein [Shewanella salipaludis]|uniref:EAL domain-containing protein n=1 Tax=Shewanella salipaludis TaxID=2723052 RepID=A0A972G7R5_9GAMM|nr:EAL domain-containing protein [Shewanella salipaludis]NMH66045.1 EAL domain-containing protein [Shewanella salipaludis]
MPRIFYQFCLSLLLLSLPSLALSETSPMKNSQVLLQSEAFGVQEGLSQSTITSMVEDKHGYLWIGTVSGLNRFDGKTFKYFLAGSKSGLQSSFIQSLAIIDNILYVGTDDGLSRYDEKLDKFTRIQSLDQATWSLNSAGENIIVGSNNSIIEINKNTLNIAKTISNELFDSVKKVLDIDDFYIVRNHDGSIISFNKKSKKAKQILSHSLDIAKINNETTIFSEHGISKLNIKTQTLSEIKKIKIEGISTSEKTIISNKNMLYYLNEFDFSTTLLGKYETMSSYSPPVLYQGKQKILVSLLNSGFISIGLNNNLVEHINTNSNNIWSLHKNDNELIISDGSESITIFNTTNNEFKEIPTKIKNITSAVIKDDTLFIGSRSGLFSISLSSGIKENLSNDNISVISTIKGNEIIYGTNDFHVVWFDLETKKSLKTIKIKKDLPIFSIKDAYNGVLYIATQGGLIELRNGEQNVIYEDDIVYSVNKFNDSIYFGTSKSILSYNIKTKKTNELYSGENPIYSISVDDIGNLSASSINEIIVQNGTKYYRVTTDFGSQIEYNTNSGEFIDGKFYFGGLDGLSAISKERVYKYVQNTLITTILNDLLVFNVSQPIDSNILSKSITYAEQINLKYSDYPFTLKFSSPASDSKKIEYYYKMSGLSDDWIADKGNDSATYTNLSPGKYIFNVYGVNPLSGKPGPTHSLVVNITPPWWLSTMAKLIYVLITILLTVTIIKTILRRRKIQKQIATSEERLKLSLWGSGDEMWDWDIETGKIYRSNIWGSLEFPRDGHRAGASDEESNIHPVDQQRVREALSDHFKGTTDHFEVAYRVKGKANEWVWILDRAKIVERDEQDNPLRMTGTIKNISNFKQAEEQLRLFERAIENISEGMFILDDQYRFVEVNDACCTISQRTRTDFIGELLHFERYPDSFSDQIRQMLKQQGRWSNDVEASKGHDDSFLMELTIDAIYDEQGELSHYVGVFSDISRRKQQEEELRKLTNNDLLTGLPNRSNLQVTLSHLVKKDTHHTLMVLDLDNFKKINDSLGHQIGDDLLRLVAERIQASIPTHTSVYRLGGDEFAVLIDKNPDIGSSAAIANQLIEGFKRSFDIQQESLVIGVSIGIVLYPEDEQNEQALLRKADIAMYHAKSAGGNRYQFFSESLNRNAIRQLEIENLIREGLKEDYFEVYYQPKVDVKLGKIAGMEALVRLKHPSLGLIPPNDFIPQAEENGLIVEIGDLVLRKACFAAQKWREQGLFSGRVAVNLSSRQFALPDLQQRIESILRLTKLPACHLELEITEGTVIKQPEVAIKVMQQLAKMGISLSLDDFGTGYSSLSYLKRFPIHTLKIDKAFVDDIDKSDRDLKMVDSIITIAHNMGLSVVGEGVEESSQLNILRALNCEEIQGFIFSKPIPEVDFTALLQRDASSMPDRKINT